MGHPHASCLMPILQILFLVIKNKPATLTHGCLEVHGAYCFMH